MSQARWHEAAEQVELAVALEPLFANI